MRRQAGFTLIEMILAMTLLGIIMAMAFAGLRASTRAADSGQDVIDRTNRLRVAQQFLRQQISRAMPMRIQDDPDDPTEFVMFEGTRDYMRFVAPMPGYLGHGGPHVQVFEIVDDGTSRKLQFNHYLLNAEAGLDTLADPDRDPVLLMEHIQDAEFSFVQLDEEGEIEGWVDTWEDPTVTPLAVRVDITMEEDSKLTFPTMEIPLVIDGGASRSSVFLGGDRGRRPAFLQRPVEDDEG